VEVNRLIRFTSITLCALIVAAEVSKLWEPVEHNADVDPFYDALGGISEDVARVQLMLSEVEMNERAFQDTLPNESSVYLTSRKQSGR
jgi:hypothetical protein